jgi:hypothetical protein
MVIRKLTASILAVLILGGATAIAADLQKEAGVPTAVFKSTTYNFPTAVDGVAIEHEFTVRNTGSADLKIEKVKTG